MSRRTASEAHYGAFRREESRMSFSPIPAVFAAVMLLAACGERPPMESTQTGYRGTGIQQVDNPRLVAKDAALHLAPPVDAPASVEGPRAREVYQNVQVLGDLSVAEFARTMAAMTAWVSPVEGCGYCHNLQNLADDSKYTKVVARKMTQMTQHLNVDWKNHVGGTGVTCYTCHRGNPVPANVWFAPAPGKTMLMLGNDGGQNKATVASSYASLPYDPFTPYLLNNAAMSDIRVTGPTALPTGNRHSIKQAEHTFSLMMHMSTSLGVNCTYCHNSRAFASWEGPPTRLTAYYGLRLAGDLNENYLKPITATFPAQRLGPAGDVAKVNCATCHQGAAKPLNGAAMAQHYPALLTITAVSPAASAASGAMAQVDAAPATLPATPAPGLAGILGKVLFETGKSDLSTEAAEVIKQAAALLAANGDVKVALSGFADRSGSADANLELAKQRAFKVRDALKAGGVADARIELKKAEFVIGDATADARRVDIVAAR